MTKTVTQSYPWITPDGKPSRFTSEAAILTDKDRVEMDVDVARQLVAGVDIPVKRNDLPDGGIELEVAEPLLFGSGETIEEAAKGAKQCFESRSTSGFHNEGRGWMEYARTLKLQIAWRDGTFEDVLLEGIGSSGHAKTS